MKLSPKTITCALFLPGLWLAAYYLPVVTVARIDPTLGLPAGVAAPTPKTEEEKRIEARNELRRGITVEKVGVYDDAMLQQMLQAAEARLAALQVIDQTQILSKLGALSGASQQTSSIGLNVQGPAVPGVVTSTKLPTQSTVQSTAAGSPNSAIQITSGLATEDVQTTRPQFNPPTSTAPTPTTTLPSSGFSVSSSDILNEQMQLSAEINSLRLMLAGDLSGQFANPNKGPGITKYRTTLGFPITLSPDPRYRDAIAIVEVEVSKPHGASSEIEDPKVTALLPRDKTYNVAAITDKSVSVGGGVATQIVGVSASWLRGNKTYYLVQDQDTVAKAFTPDRPNSVGFQWEFRPVLGQQYVRAGLRQTFVQLAFDTFRDPEEGEIGNIIYRTYWRRYDRKRGIPKEIIPGSLSRDGFYSIPRYTLGTDFALNSSNIEDADGGQIMVSLKGRFLPGTYVRVGPKLLSGSPNFTHEYAGIRFLAGIADLARKDVFVVSHDGSERRLNLSGCGISVRRDGFGNPLYNETIKLVIKDPSITAIDDTNSEVKMKFQRKKTSPGHPDQLLTGEPPALVMIVGQNVYGFSQLKRNGNEISAIVPTALLTPNTELSLQTLFPNRGCRSDTVAVNGLLPAKPEKLVVLERRKEVTTFLLYGNKLSALTVRSPYGASIVDLPATDPDKMRMLVLTAGNLETNKQVLLQRPGEKPFLVTIPELEPKKTEPPQVRGALTVDSDDALIEGEGLKTLESVTCITCKVKSVAFEVIDDKTVRLTGLRGNLGASGTTPQTLVLQFKSGSKVKVGLRFVSWKVENNSQ